MADLPTGTVTFLLTDIEGSTRLWEAHPQAMEAALARHDALVAEVLQDYGWWRAEGKRRTLLHVRGSLVELLSPDHP